MPASTSSSPPNANGCFGDTGGPILINDGGQTYVAGVGYFVGLSCADEFFGAFVVDPCAAQFDALNTCFSQ